MKNFQTMITVITFALISTLLLVVANRLSKDSVLSQLAPQQRQIPTTALQSASNAKPQLVSTVVSQPTSTVVVQPVSNSEPQLVSTVVSQPASIAALQSVSVVELQGLTITFAADRTQYTLGEPVLITVTAQNQTNEPIVFYDGFDIGAGLIGVQVSADGDEFRYYNGPFPMASQEFVTRTLNPGVGRSLSFGILANRPSGPETLPHFYAFTQPGHYQLRAVLQNIIPGETLISNSIIIEMLAPQGVDAQIWRLLQSQDAADFLQTGSARTPAVVEKFQTILAQYPDNLYAPYLHRALKPTHVETTETKPEIQTARAQSAPTLRVVNDQLYFVRSTTDNKARAASSIDEEILNEIVNTIQAWVDAWNNQDLDGYAQIHSRQTKTWQDWQTGPESRPYYKLNKGVQSMFSSTGKVIVDITGFTIGTDDIIVDVTPHFTGKRFVFNGMRFVQDEDGVWRLASLE